MADYDRGRLKNYLQLITRKSGGLEGQIERLRQAPETVVESSGLESMEGGADKVEMATLGLQQAALERPLSDAELAGLEAIIDEDLRPAFFVTNNTFVSDHPLWRHLNEADNKARIEKALLSIGRIELPGHPRLPYGGTGFVVGDGLIMTNRHVAELFARGLGTRRLDFITGARAGIDFLQERGGKNGATLEVRKVVLIHPYWDMAILAVEGLPPNREPLKLSLDDPRLLPDRNIFIVGYPAFDGRNPTNVQTKLFESFRVKRLQPGMLHGTISTASYGKMVPAAGHDCSTLGGNSGSPVLDLETGHLLGLHFGGLYHDINYAVPASDLGRDSRVVDTGIKFAGTPTGTGNNWGGWWDRADATEAADESDNANTTIQKPALTPEQAVRSVVANAGNGDGSVTIEVPLVITVSLGRTGRGLSVSAQEAVAAEAAPDSLEAMREPRRDRDYSSRLGYNANFLGERPHDAIADPFFVPLPASTEPGLLAESDAGETILHYQNFSIAMHRERRLALFTAANISREPALRKPNPRKKYTRKALTGLGDNDREKWFLDDRLDEDFQLPDVFFTRDRGSFDKGHLVRREDVAWGTTYDEVVRANGDSYHVTNCSPQTKEFNQSSQGEDNWGDLENVVLSEAANERLCVFSGPVLADEDQAFQGKGVGGVALWVRIPGRFWKVIVARTEAGIAAYGFVLEQDLSATDFTEFTVPPEFVPAMYPIADIAGMTRVKFDGLVLNADQYDTVRGGEVAMRSGTRRKRRRR